MNVATPLTVLVAGAALLGLSGCTAAAPAGGGTAPSPAATRQAKEVTPEAVPQSGLAKGLSLPLAAYMQTYPESRTIQAAVFQLEHDCMARYGFSYDPKLLSGSSPSYDDTNLPRRYGITDRRAAEQFGYGLGDDGFTPPATPKLTAAEVAVFTGRVEMKPGAARAPEVYNGLAVPRDGCQGEAVEKVGARIDTTLAGRLDAESLDKSQQDPAVQEVIRKWSGCMAAKGYTVSLPYDAVKLTARGNGASVSAAETAVALADIDCKEQTGLVATWFKVDSDIQRGLIERNQLALKETRDRISAAVKRATEVVGH